MNLDHNYIPFNKVWKIKSFFVTARDRLQWTKVWHRTLYTVGKDAKAESHSCTACSDTENILHLATCHIIRLEFWSNILEILTRLGLPAPEDVTTFIVLGRIDADPKSETFPMTNGWTIDGEKVCLDRLTIKTYTDILRLRKFKPPAAEKSWPPRLCLEPTNIPFKKVWKIKSFFATARDRLQWTKVWHRTLYTVGKDTSAESNQCVACSDTENILHLATCDIIKLEFWDTILETLARMGMATPEDEVAFLILGRLDAETVIDAQLSGIMFLAWRCLYAEITKARIEKANPDMKYVALERTGAMCVTRLMTYGATWHTWSSQRVHTSRGHLTALALREQRVFKMNGVGEYTIHEEILKLANKTT